MKLTCNNIESKTLWVFMMILGRIFNVDLNLHQFSLKYKIFKTIVLSTKNHLLLTVVHKIKFYNVCLQKTLIFPVLKRCTSS